MRYYTLLGLVTIAFVLGGHSCKTNENGRSIGNQPARDAGEPSIEMIKVTATANGDQLLFGDQLVLMIEQVKDAESPDSIKVWFNGDEYKTYKGELPQIVIDTRDAGSVGKKQYRISAYKEGYRPQVIMGNVELLSDLVPVNYSYRVVKRYHHDPSAYTQGLLFYDGYLYESTGQPGESSVRKVEVNTGKVLDITNLESRFFGEGLARVDGFLYQLTWTSKVGFVYDLGSLKQVKKIYYQTEGWGLTNYGGNLMMSDGSQKLRVMSPEDFSMLSSFDVYDNKGPVSQLNELENIDGEIWANIYTTDRIVIIEPETGRVKGYINLAGILPKSDIGPDTDVLNGIARDQEGKRLFVTGKNWPALFEIELIKK